MKPEEELTGLPTAIDNALKEHPGWTRNEDGIAVCSGPGCDWRKTTRTATNQAWRKHQKYTLSFAIERWYFNEPK